jgi:hypothetical protein
MSLSGHLLLVVIVRFALCGAIELQHGVNADFPDALGDTSPFVKGGVKVSQHGGAKGDH